MDARSDGPPILLFLMMFTGMLAIVVCIAALVQRADPTEDAQPAPVAGHVRRMAAGSQDLRHPPAPPPASEPATASVAGGKPEPKP